jgi:hypothetical protein
VRQIPENDTTPHIVVMSKPVSKRDEIEGQMLWLLQMLWEDGQQLFLASLPDVVDELGRLIASEQQAKEMVSGFVASVLDDVSIIAQVIGQIGRYQPWAQTFEHYAAEEEKELEAELEKSRKHWKSFSAAREGPAKAKIARPGIRRIRRSTTQLKSAGRKKTWTP